MAGIRAQKDHLLQSASMAMRRALFGETGYGLDTLGTEESVQKLQAGRLEGVSRAAYGAEQLRAGHLRRCETDEARAAVEKAFAGWKPNPGAASLEKSATRHRHRIRSSASPKPATRNKPCWSLGIRARQ